MIAVWVLCSALDVDFKGCLGCGPVSFPPSVRGVEEVSVKVIEVSVDVMALKRIQKVNQCPVYISANKAVMTAD